MKAPLQMQKATLQKLKEKLTIFFKFVITPLGLNLTPIPLTHNRKSLFYALVCSALAEVRGHRSYLSLSPYMEKLVTLFYEGEPIGMEFLLFCQHPIAKSIERTLAQRLPFIQEVYHAPSLGFNPGCTQSTYLLPYFVVDSHGLLIVPNRKVDSGSHLDY